MYLCRDGLDTYTTKFQIQNGFAKKKNIEKKNFLYFWLYTWHNFTMSLKNYQRCPQKMKKTVKKKLP